MAASDDEIVTIGKLLFIVDVALNEDADEVVVVFVVDEIDERAGECIICMT
jgi:hypothetical protein